MSLISKIKSRRMDDLINEGLRMTLTGTATSGTSTIYVLPDTRFFIVTGYQLSSDAVSAELVTLSLDNGTTSVDFYTGYIGGGQTANVLFSLADWLYGDLGYDIKITVSGAITVAYTVEGRVSSSPTPLGYIQQIGTQEHSNPVFPPDSGLARGQSEF